MDIKGKIIQKLELQSGTSKAGNAWKKQDGYEIAAIMARLPEWEKTGERVYIEGYGRQRPYTRKLSR